MIDMLIYLALLLCMFAGGGLLAAMILWVIYRHYGGTLSLFEWLRRI